MADRYAAALYELAEERGALDVVSADLATLQALLDASAELRRVIASPVVGREAQRKALDALVQAVGLSELTRNFVGLVSSNRRAFALADMIKAFQARRARARGEVTAHVATATPLSADQAAALEAALKKAVGTVSVAATVDPSLLGGMVVRIGSRMIDSSLRTKLKRLHFAMKGVG